VRPVAESDTADLSGLRRLWPEENAGARRAGPVRVVLHPSDRAVPFYERAGFGQPTC
jgi:hypothetical protein